MPQVIRRVVLLGLAAVAALVGNPARAQMATGYRPIEEPGLYGVRVHTGAMAPNLRKWYLPQNLYYEYQWRGWEYSNYARDIYQKYVDILLEGTRYYDPFGNYIARGWSIYDWTENNPQRQGSGIFKSPKYSSWFSNLVISSAQKGQFFTSLAISDALRTTMTPLTFSKPTFNGLQWDFLSDKYAVTLLASRLNSPGVSARTDSDPSSLIESTTRVMGARGVAQVGDFAQMGATWINAANTRSDLSMGDNSLKGVLTTPQNTGNVETVTIRISDDSPETAQSGALLFFDRVLVDGEVHPEIQPIIRGGVRNGSSLEANGGDVIELIYDIRNSFRPTEKVPTVKQIQKLEFELIMANDYRIEVTSNRQTDLLGDQVFLPVVQARGEITDGSNQRFIRFEYGLPTANEVLGLDLQINNLAGLDLRSEYAVNRRFRRFPNQNYDKLAAADERAGAAYLTASYVRYPWFAYGEAFSMDPDYSTTAFMGNNLGVVDYSDPRRNLFEFVDDNDDQDRFADWQRAGQQGAGLGASAGSTGEDIQVFPGLDENNDFVSDYNQNRNDRPDYTEPFLRYAVDAPQFLFGMDMNNNTLIDRFEDDRAPDYPYERDHRGANLYGGLKLTEDLQLTTGHLQERLLSSDRKSRVLYGLFTAIWNYPGLTISIFEHAKRVKDDIPEDRVVWVDPKGRTDFTDPLDAQDTFINTFYLESRYSRVRNLNISGKLKYERFFQHGEQADLKRNRSFLGLINKADYVVGLGKNLTFWPKWKSTFQHEVPSLRAVNTSRSLEEALFLVTRVSLIPRTTWIDLGVELSWFENLKKRPATPQVGFVDDFRSLVFSFLFSNTSAYQGYHLTLNSGLQLERQKFKDTTQKGSMAFLRVYASTGPQ
ncbi:MAG: hypothetical protein FJY95_00820 [Candidatus Handelsmanbacteria bacterium]|nr:hypothetical protein [Candidatus Handelsmanbacteria bacterium]